MRACLQLLVFACSIAVLFASRQISSRPLLLWASQSNLDQVPQTLEESDVSSLLNRFMGSKPKTVLAFVFSEMSSSQFSSYFGAYSVSQSRFAQTKAAVSSAQSAYVPFVLDSKSTTMLEQLQSSSVPNQVLSEDDACASPQSIFAESNPGTYVIRMSKQFDPSAVQTQDTCMKALSMACQDCISVITSEHSSPVVLDHGSTEQRLGLIETQANVGASSGKVEKISPAIIFGLVLTFLFLMMLFCGLSCLMSVQTPLRFPSRKLAINKEY